MILNQLKLNGRVAIVPGTAQGLGQGYAVALTEIEKIGELVNPIIAE